MAWFDGQQPTDKKDAGFEVALGDLSKKVDEKFGKVDSIETTVNSLKESLSGLTDIADYVKEQRKAQQVAQQRQQQANSQVAATSTKDALNAVFYDDPAQAIELAQRPMLDRFKRTEAKLAMAEMFQDGDRFPYYHGTIKKEVDAMAALQPVVFFDHPDNIENLYNAVIGKRAAEIAEGKLAKRSSLAQGSGGSNGNSSSVNNGKEPKAAVQLTDDVKKAAKAFGYGEQEYAEMIAEQEGIGV
jgi:hypothetical protein